jgi:hypothetical protein
MLRPKAKQTHHSGATIIKRTSDATDVRDDNGLQAWHFQRKAVDVRWHVMI